MFSLYRLSWGYAAIETGQPSDPCLIGIGDTPAEAGKNLETTPWQTADSYHISDRELIGIVMQDMDGVGPMTEADDDERAQAYYAAHPDEAAADLRRAISDDDEDEATRIAAAITEIEEIECSVETDEGDEDQEIDGVVYRTYSQSLIMDGRSVATWERVIAASWGGQHGEQPADTWESWEDTQGGGGVPGIVQAVLDELGLDADADDLPGPDEPDEPDEDEEGEYGYAEARDGERPDKPDYRYATVEDRDEAMGFWQRRMRARYPGGWLEPQIVPMRLVDGAWQLDHSDSD